ncbi:aminoacyl-tRNA hydrolase [Oceanibacterium hippocampi]|uniref:Peptidyl-tRNA hydrolase n=1 Tax=Oceanibacterium hippocampi TaxID=745714 RepID=A0A1Y5TVV0_9PROT|nr:aminoacyl-tRNA hydrolase [Oceanibacterium hippocampi]SLN74533.1 Peptidyl-tRNA hydrolase [Oceanibacterium hippocampi]
MLLLVGLGNPGPEHARDRHNLGFMAVETIIDRHDFGPARSRFRGLVAEGRLGNERVLALCPLTYMNNSGESVGEAMRFYKLAPEQLVVIYDELDLALGKIRMKTGGGSAGHNGIRSITAHVNGDYRRLRLGIGHPGDRARVIAHVLKPFSGEERPIIDDMLDCVAEAAPKLGDGDDPGFMTLAARLMHERRAASPERT